MICPPKGVGANGSSDGPGGPMISPVGILVSMIGARPGPGTKPDGTAGF